MSHLMLPLQEVLAHFLGIAAGGFRVLGRLGIDLDELAAQALHLLFDRRAHIEGRDHGAQALGGSDGLQAGDADPKHEHLGRSDGPGGRHHHGKGSPKFRRRVEDRLIAGQVALRR